jgi:predicted ATPase with chaperone activity
VLFFEELPEFTRPALEALRQPRDEGEVVVARAAGAVRMPARCTVVAAITRARAGSRAITTSSACARRSGWTATAVRTVW